MRSKLSMRDPDLQSILYLIQSERLASLSQPIGRRPTQEQTPRQDRAQRLDHNRPQHQQQHRRTPKEVLDALPRRGGLSICLKHLSATGCASKSPNRCAFPTTRTSSPITYPTWSETALRRTWAVSGET